MPAPLRPPPTNGASFALVRTVRWRWRYATLRDADATTVPEARAESRRLPSTTPARVATRNVPRDDYAMRIKHKELRALAEQDRPTRLPPDLVPRLRRILTALDEAQWPHDIDARPGYRLHPLKGSRAGQWSISVSGNWRVVFRFEGREVVDVDLVDYH